MLWILKKRRNENKINLIHFTGGFQQKKKKKIWDFFFQLDMCPAVIIKGKFVSKYDERIYIWLENITNDIFKLFLLV